MSQLPQLRKGSTRLLVLNVLAEEPKYGYQIMRELETQSEGYFTMTAALLYPVLHKLEADGLVTAEWQEPTGVRKRKYYAITRSGRAAITDYVAEWRLFMTKLFSTLNLPEEGQA
ncbi:MAG: PadR family transcriptional regulator [Chloroflexi bacterium]|nr:PadR family transcriptional regulator [Chloroflexota bacterium]